MYIRYAHVIKVKKNKTAPVHAMKVYKGRRGTTPFILNLRNKGRCVVSFMPRQEALNARLAGVRSPSGSLGEEKNIWPLSGIETRTVVRDLVTILTTFDEYYCAKMTL
jgi:hypothetical protein